MGGALVSGWGWAETEEAEEVEGWSPDLVENEHDGEHDEEHESEHKWPSLIQMVRRAKGDDEDK